jgi:hypothetical protein
MFIEHRLDKETSSIRSDLFLFMPLLTELHFQTINGTDKHAAPTALDVRDLPIGFGSF